MRIIASLAVVAMGMACATGEKNVIRTQVVTFPDGALVEINGTNAGRAPAKIILPQDSTGKLTARAEVRAVPNSAQTRLYPQLRVFDPEERTDRVPEQIMIDMTWPGTNNVMETVEATSQVESGQKRSRAKVPYVERSKPTQAVGLDRWVPGQY